MATIFLLASIGHFPGRAQGAFPGRNGLIAFDSDRSGGAKIFTIRADGSHLRKLTAGIGPSFSPDGRKIAFTLGTGTLDEHEIYTMNADGSGRRQVTRGGNNTAASFSPNGKSLVYERNPGGGYELFTIGVDGKHRHRLTYSPSGISNFGPSYSPDGREIVFMRNLPQGEAICTVNASGLHLHVLVRTTATIQMSPNFSPNGKQIVFSNADATGATHVFVMDANGSNIRALTSSPNDIDGSTKFSPDGTQIVFSGVSGNGGLQVFTIRVDGSHILQLTHSSPSVSNDDPSWQPLRAC